MLGEEPADRRRPGFSLGQFVRTFGQTLSELRKAPRRQVARIRNGRNNFEFLSLARKDHESEAGLSIEPVGLEQGPVFGRAGFAQSSKFFLSTRWIGWAFWPRSAASRVAR